MTPDSRPFGGIPTNWPNGPAQDSQAKSIQRREFMREAAIAMLRNGAAGFAPEGVAMRASNIFDAIERVVEERSPRPEGGEENG